MSIADAELSDIYVDEGGKLWRCIATCGEPTVTFEEVEGRTLPPPGLNQYATMQAQQNTYSPPAPSIIKDRKSGGVSGLMWNRWNRVYRPGKKEP